MKNIYIPVGVVYTYDNVQITPIPTPFNESSCKGCYFSDHERSKLKLNRISCYLHKLGCTPMRRKDKINVIFKKV